MPIILVAGRSSPSSLLFSSHVQENSMDVLARLADDEFHRYSICQDIAPNLEVWLILVYIHQSKSDMHTAPYDRIETAFPRSIPHEISSDPILQLIIIPIDQSDHRLPITTSVLKRLITNQLKIDPGVLWFIASSYDGFHRLDSAASTTYILANSLYMLIWRFDEHQGVSGIFLERRRVGIYDRIPAHLRLFSRYYQSPGLLAFIVCHLTCNYMDYVTENHDLRSIQYVESITAFGPDNDHVPLHRHETVQIMSWLKSMAGVHINMGNKLRFINIISTAMDDIYGDLSDTSLCAEDDDHLGFRPAVRLLTSRITASKEYMLYLKERADQISSVV